MIPTCLFTNEFIGTTKKIGSLLVKCFPQVVKLFEELREEFPKSDSLKRRLTVGPGWTAAVQHGDLQQAISIGISEVMEL
jgi:hypothetical protein